MAEEKLNILEEEYQIPIENEIREDVNTMCNLSEGIEEKGIAKGIEKGMEQGLAQGLVQGRKEGQEAERRNDILRLLKKNYTIEQIADLKDMKSEEVKALVEKKSAVYSENRA